MQLADVDDVDGVKRSSPRSCGDDASHPHSESRVRQQGQPPTILVVECPEIQRFIRTALSRFGYNILESDTHEAMRLLRGPGLAIDLLITNVPEPFLGACEDLRILYISSSPDFEMVSAAKSGLISVLVKPFRFQTLIDRVRGMLEPGS